MRVHASTVYIRTKCVCAHYAVCRIHVRARVYRAEKYARLRYFVRRRTKGELGYCCGEGRRRGEGTRAEKRDIYLFIFKRNDMTVVRRPKDELLQKNVIIMYTKEHTHTHTF